MLLTALRVISIQDAFALISPGLFGNKLAGVNGKVRLNSNYKIFEGRLKCSSGGAAEVPGQCQCLDELGDQTCCQVFLFN